MKCQYLLIGIFMLVSFQALPQYQEVYAAATPRPMRLESYSLKQGLKEVEKAFSVSIAYRDEWVENQVVQASKINFNTAEEALDMMLRQTSLYYEKGGEKFYVIYERKKMKRALQSEPTASVSTTPLLFRFPTQSYNSDFLAERLATISQKQEIIIGITGKVKDETGADFPGVNVLVKGTSIGTSTDVNGNYSLEVSDESAILVFSFIGYTTQEVTVGARTSVDLTMAPDIKSLDEVVVTALGIEKSAKSLGYATTTVSSDQFAINRSPNVMNTLQGKIAGVNISGLGTGPAGTSKIRIRGQSSIGGQNNPLIVINGVPIDNTNFGSNPSPNAAISDGSVQSRGGGVTSDGGDGLSSINPDDIETMTVLKGGTAAALYGSRAKDGVIMITTKSKGTGQGVGLTYNMNYTNETPLDFTDYQYEYGQGEYGVRPTSANPTSGQWSFGERIQPGMTQVLFNNLTVPYEAQRGILKDFYRNGQNLTHSVTLSSNGEKGGMNLSIANLDSKGITPNNSYNRKTINIGFDYKLSKKLSFRGSANYSKELNKNPPVVGEQDNSIPTSLFAMANTMPLSVLRDNMYNPGGGEYVYSRFTNRTNPYWALAEQFQNVRRDRIFGNVSIKYQLLSWLSVQGRIGQDFWARDQDYVNLPTGKASISSGSIAAALPGFVNGLYTQENRRFRETNMDFLFIADKEFGDFGVNFTFGGNQLRRRSDINSTQVTDFIVKGFYTVQNGRAKDPTYSLIESQVNSLYGSLELNYKRFIYLNATAREDWFSTLSSGKPYVFYPSVSLSYVFSEQFATLPNWLDLGKFRAAYARVGSDNDVGAYQQQLLYTVNAQFINGQPVGAIPSTLPNPGLISMTVSEIEFGLETRLFNDRVGFDATVYEKLTEDQILPAQISDASGFTITRINQGTSRNRGVELMLNIVPVKTSNFQWDFTFAGAYNKTKVIKLYTEKEGENITVGNHVFNGSVQQVVGKEIGQIVGFGYRRDDGSINPANQGRIVYGANGIPLPTATQILFGSAIPKWVGGFTNSFTYKGVSLSVLIDFKLGNKMLSGTNFNAYRHGLHQATLVGREGGVTGDGVTVTSQENEAVAVNEDYYSVVRGAGLIEPVVYNGGYWKLRQITLGYDFTKFFPANGIVKGVRLNFVANNVFMLKKWVDNIDPETFGYSSDSLVGMESPGVPSTRSLGFNLNVKF